MTTPDPKSFEATLLRASYEGITFPVEQADTETSHDGVGHKAYRVDGADYEPTGLNEDKGTLVVPLFNGIEGRFDLYPATYKYLLQAIKLNPLGRLVHPTRGSIRAFMSVAREQLSADRDRDGVRLTLTWAEHNQAAQRPTNPVTSPALQSRTQCILLAQRADLDIEALVGSLIGLVTGPILLAELIEGYFNDLAVANVSYGAVAAAFAAMGAAVQYNRSLDVLRSASATAAVYSLAQLSAALIAAQDVYMPRVADRTTYRVVSPMAVWDVAEAVYGDCRKTGPLFAANVILNPTFIASGTVLVILPDPDLTT